jgi:hypothetical protein
MKNPLYVKGIKQPSVHDAVDTIPYITGAIAGLAEGTAGAVASGGNPLVAGAAALQGYETAYLGTKYAIGFGEHVAHSVTKHKAPVVPAISPSNNHTFNRMIPRYDSVLTDVTGQRIGQPPQIAPVKYKKRGNRLPSMRNHRHKKK